MQIHDSNEKPIELKKNREVEKMTIDVVKSHALLLANILLVVVILFLIAANNAANSRAEVNQQITYVKMMPNGDWQVEFNKQYQNEFDFSKASVEQGLWSYVETRHSKVPELIRSYYGKALVYMSPEVQQDFMSPSGFNAPVVATELSPELTDFDEIVELRFFDHNEQYYGYYSSGVEDIYSTKVYITRKFRNRKTKEFIESLERKEVIALKWRLESEDNKRRWEREKILANAVGVIVVEDKQFIDK